jgi:glycosyltransferase EpsD
MNDEDHRIATRQNLVHGPIIPTFGMGVPDPRFNLKPGEIRKKYAKDSDYVLLFAGELSKRKNQRFLIDAMPDLIAKIPEAKLWLLGDGDELSALKLQAQKLGVSERIVFIGRKKNSADYMRDCDLYVSASLIEGLPFNIVEALGVGKPVLASRIKGHTDILHHAAGILFDPHNKKDFVEKVTLVRDGKITLSENRIHHGYRNFSAATVFADTYEKLKEASRL